MDTGKAIFLGLALIALAIFATDVMRPAQAGADQIGRYNISASGGHYAFLIDTSTGRYRRCSTSISCGEWRDRDGKW
jgi:hypothetical protein